MAASRAEERRGDGELSASLPTDILLRIISRLPSPLLFGCRTLSKEMHKAASLALARRPFFLYQSLSSHCFLLPLDTPSTPLPVTFRLGDPPFKVAFAKSTLVCFQRRDTYVLNICVCSIFCNWKLNLTRIVDPDYNEDGPPVVHNMIFNLTVVEFEVLSAGGSERHSDVHVHGADGRHVADDEGVRANDRLFCSRCNKLHHFRDVVGNCGVDYNHGVLGKVCIKEFDVHVHGAHGADGRHVADDEGVRANDGLFCRRCNKPHHFRVAVGYRGAVDNHGVCEKGYYKEFVFDSRYLQWSKFDHHQLTKLTTPYALTLYDDRTYKLKVKVPHVKDANNKVLELEAILPTDRAVEGTNFNEPVSDRDLVRHMQIGLGVGTTHGHHHSAKHYHVCSYDLVYQDRIYVFMIDFERLTCKRGGQKRSRGSQDNIMTIEEAMKYLWVEEDTGDRCDELFPASTTCRLMLYTIHVDVTIQTLQISKENASTLLKLSNMSTPPTFRERESMGKFFIMEGGGASH